jgi:hypothetical protein
MGLISSVYRSGPVPRWWLQEQEKYEVFETVFKLLDFLARTYWKFTQFRIRACYSSQIISIRWFYSIASFFDPCNDPHSACFSLIESDSFMIPIPTVNGQHCCRIIVSHLELRSKGKSMFRIHYWFLGHCTPSSSYAHATISLALVSLKATQVPIVFTPSLQSLPQ